MKDPREISFAGFTGAQQAVRHLLRVRFAECLEQQSALNGDDDDAIHAFRLACKRLRYALERLPSGSADLTRVANLLEDITDELGAAHDCVVLAERAENCDADLVAARALRDRRRYLQHASRLWGRAFRSGGAFEPLATFTGFQWTLKG